MQKKSNTIYVCGILGFVLTIPATLVTFLSGADMATVGMDKATRALGCWLPIIPTIGYGLSIGVAVYLLKKERLARAKFMASVALLMPILCTASAIAPGLFVILIPFLFLAIAIVLFAPILGKTSN